MEILIYSLNFISGFCLGMSLFFTGLRDEVSLGKLALPEGAQELAAANPKKKTIISIFKPYLKLFAPINRRLIVKFYRGRIGTILETLKVPLSVIEFFALKELFMIGLPFAVYLVLGKLELPWILGPAVLGFFIPDLWLRQRDRRRKRLILKNLPDVIDLLSLCVSAGLDFMLALRWVVEKSKQENNPLIEELAQVMQEIKMGKSRRQALKDFSSHINIPDISSFVRTLIQTDRIGTPISEALAIISEECRANRFRRGERMALQAPFKMLVPLIFFMLAVIIIVGGPVFLQFSQAGIKF